MKERLSDAKIKEMAGKLLDTREFHEFPPSLQLLSFGCLIRDHYESGEPKKEVKAEYRKGKCPRCRSQNPEKCHSIECPMRVLRSEQEADKPFNPKNHPGGNPAFH